MKRTVIAAVLGCFIFLSMAAKYSYAGEIDLLLQKLVEKGVLTAGEAQQVKIETKEEIKKEISQAKYDLLPEWLQRVKFKGDFRLRYEGKRERGAKDENMGKIRLRQGVEVKVNDQMKAGFGLATGTTSNPRSTNVTFGGTSGTPASFKDITVDYAYGSYSPRTWITMTGGKFKNPIWQPTDLLWDGDLNPEGGNVQLDYRLNPYFGTFLNAMAFVMAYDSNRGSDTVMWAVQPGIKYNWKDKVDLKAAVTAYMFTNLKGKAKYSKQSTNSLNSSSEYKYNYNSVNPSVEIGIRDPFVAFPLLAKYIPYAGIYSDYIYNPDPATGKSGFDAGLKFGAEKVGDWGQWQAKVLYAKLGRDAFLDILPDSDRYSGKTNMKSLEFVLEYGLGKNTSIALDYYWAKSLSAQTSGGAAGSYIPQQLIQVDWNLKW